MDKMDEIIDQLKVVQATAFSLYLKAHNYHWNVTGPNFSEYHTWFGDFYTAVWQSVDLYAEKIRILGGFAPGSLSRFSELTEIEDELNIPEARVMFERLADDNDVLLGLLYETAALAEDEDERGLINFLEGQIDAHEKWRWMLKSFG